MSDDGAQPVKKSKFNAGALLRKQGWTDGQGLGKELQGRNTYVTVKKNNGDLGVGGNYAAFKEKDVQKHKGLLDATLAEIKRKKKEKKALQKKIDAGEAVDTAEPTPEEPEEQGNFVSKAKLVGGMLEEEAEPAGEASDEDSDNSSRGGGGGGGIGIMTDADLFSACRGARFGKLGRHTNSQKKIQRIRNLEATQGAVIVKEVRARWSISQTTGNENRSPVHAPCSPKKKVLKRKPVEDDDTAAPSKKEKKEKKDKKEKKEKKAAKRSREEEEEEAQPPKKKEKKEKKDKKEKKSRKE